MAQNQCFWAKNAVFGGKKSVFGNESSVKGGGGVPPFSVNFSEKSRPWRPRGGTESFRAWGFWTLPLEDTQVEYISQKYT